VRLARLIELEQKGGLKRRMVLDQHRIRRFRKYGDQNHDGPVPGYVLFRPGVDFTISTKFEMKHEYQLQERSNLSNGGVFVEVQTIRHEDDIMVSHLAGCGCKELT